MAVQVNGQPLSFEASIALGQFQVQIDNMERSLKNLTRTSEREAKSIENLVQKTTTAIAAYASIATATNFVGDIVRVRGEFQQLSTAFKVMLGSKEKADKLLAQAVELAAKTPFTLQEVATGAKQLLAYGFSADKITDNLVTLGNVASGVSAPLGDIVYLYGTLRTQGRAYTRDIMQFSSRGIPIISELAKQLGVSEKEVLGLVEAGKVGFPEVEAAFESMTSEGGRFFNLMQEQSKTLTGQISNLQDAWSRMLNDIGKGQEGIFSKSILAATDLINNYQDVLDVIKKLIIIYGSYRAAIIINSTVQAIATSRAQGYTIVETLRLRAMLLSEAAMKLLNKTMLANPIVAVITGLTALVLALKFFTKQASEASRHQKIFNDISNDAAKSTVAEKDNLQQLLTVAKDHTKTRDQQETALRKIIALSPTHLENLTLENLKTAEGIRITKEYIKYLDKKAIAQAVTAKKQQLLEQNIDLEVKRDALRAAGVTTGAPGLFATRKQETAKFALVETEKAIDDNKKAIEAMNTKYEDALTAEIVGEGKKQVAIKRTIDVIDEEIKAERAKQTAKSSNRAENDAFEKNINKLLKERAAITGDKKTTKEIEKAGTQRLEDLKQLLEEINQVEIDASRSGMAKEAAEIDKINERYDALKKRANDLKADQKEINRIEFARSTQLGNLGEKAAFEKYKTFIEQQKTLFNEFEDYKQKVGLEKAQEITKGQTLFYTDFIEFLKLQLALVSKDTSITGISKKKLLSSLITDAEKDKTKRDVDIQIENLKRVVDATVTFNIQRKELEKQFQEDLAILRKNFTGKDLEERENALRDSHNQELIDLENSVARQTDLYKLLNEDIIRFSRAMLEKRVKDLKSILEKSINLSPQLKADIQATIDKLKGLIDSTKDDSFSEDFKTAGEWLKFGAQQAETLASAMEGVNDELAEAIHAAADMANILGNALTAVGQFAAGDIVGGISSSVAVIAGIFNIGKKAREERRKHEEEVQNFLNAQFKGEQEINILYRERAREIVRINRLRLEGIAAEKLLLIEQKKLNKEQADSVLKELQSLTARVRKEMNLGPLSNVMFSVESLAGKSFEDLEKLFLKGQLEGKALELFNILQKIKAEGVDIDSVLAQNAEEAQQLFTGTTGETIADSIIEGFKNGKKGMADFAGTFEDLMRDAIFNSLKFQALEGPLKEFMQAFAGSAESGGVLTEDEIRILKERFASLIKDAGDKFEELQNITNLNLSGPSAGGASLSGAIKGITEQQAELLAGSFGGLRLTALEQLNVAKQSMDTLNKIQVNTGLTAVRVLSMHEELVNYFNVIGIKVR